MRWVCVVLLGGCQLVFDVEPPRPACFDNPSYVELPGITDGHRYRIDTVLNVRWQVAQTACQIDEAHLAAPVSISEFTALGLAIANDPDVDADVWVGVARNIDDPVDQFRFVTGEPVPQDYFRNPPTVTPENDAAVLLDGELIDIPPGRNVDFVCECGGVATVAFDFF